MSRHDGVLAALALVAGGAAIAFTWQPGLASLYDDSVFYLMMAQAISPFGQASPAVLAATPFDTYPPMLPVLLAMFGGAFDWRTAHAIVAATFGASVFLLGQHARLTTSSAAMGIACALVYALLPGAWLNVKGILSEFPYMALSFAILVLYERVRGEPLRARLAIGLGVLLAALILTRTVGVALVAAIAACEALAWWRKRERARLAAIAWVVGLPIAIVGLWILLRPSSGQDAYAEFGVRVAEAAQAGGSSWIASMLGANLSALEDAWLNALLIYWGDWWTPKFLLAALIGLVGLGATIWRALRAEVDALYCLAFLAIVLAWPFPGQMYRLALPVIPLVLVNALWAWRELVLHKWPVSEARAPWAAVLPLVLCLPAVMFYIAGRASAPDDTPGEMRRADIAEFYRVPSGPSAAANASAQIGVFRDLEHIRATTPESARVLWYSPAYVALLAQRRGVRLERPADAAAFEAQLRATGADFVYLAHLHPRDSAHRLGHPLDPLAFAELFAREVWRRNGPDGEPRAVLLAVDRSRIPDTQRSK
jgi:hypothetical protein